MRRSWLAAVLVCAGGCNSILGIDDLTLSADGGSSGDAQDCVGTVAPTCFMVPPTGAVSLGGTIDTSSDPRCVVVTQANGVDMCALRAVTFTTSAPVTVQGTRPLMLVATGSITITHDVQAASLRGGPIGPGAGPSMCQLASDGSNSGSDGGGGGAGGTFATEGGDGGDGGGSSGANGANTTTVTAIAGIRGGCAGSNGGRGSSANVADVGVGGAGGGALYLVAGTTIDISAHVNASGAPGEGGLRRRTGGGGGGTGGMIVLEATAITLTGAGASVFAKGGGGGEGATDGSPGGPGLSCPTWNGTGTGGQGLNGAGDGGDGAVIAGNGQDGRDGSGSGIDGGGGGGGGGGGLVQMSVMPSGSASGQVSPLPMLVVP